ncbi:uncharacterized protein HD556DRAFT_1338251 [Suillus plorans]|uniref:Uncharacterized protein n=1 Tax=Suillus plorans TaxID=116603 RepID=A0A9P7DRR4_9AGAM|nr:uncharacterized protein HD556DRAFT_1338251 [Suillus plorans]KAG1801548.1 hypothetical protein HD556DRAFT_1338251 [Suillus plorans]
MSSTPFSSILATLTWPPMLVNSTPSLWKLRILGFMESDLILNTCHSVSFTICGDVCRVAQTDCVSLIRLPRIRETAAQITFPLHAMTIPCITVIGTRPIFCFVSVTEALRVAVTNGQYPEADALDYR